MFGRCMRFALLCSVLAATACDESVADEPVEGNPDGTGEGPDAGETPGNDPGPDTDAEEVEFVGLEAPARTNDPFAVVVDAERMLGVVGETLTFSARITRAEASGEPRFAWDTASGMASTTDAAVVEVSFDAPGIHEVSVAVTDDTDSPVTAGALVTIVDDSQDSTVGDVDGDGMLTAADRSLAEDAIAQRDTLEPEEFARADVDLDGAISQRDLDLIDDAIGRGQAPRSFSATRGAMGRRITLIHPALLDPSTDFQVELGDSAPITPYRSRPGYAVFMVPPDAGTAGMTELALRVDGETIDTEPFELLATPSASADPGDKMLQAMERLEELLADLPQVLDLYLSNVDATMGERTAIRAMLEVSSVSFANQRQAFQQAFSEMEPEARAVYEQVALANGLDDVLTGLEDRGTELNELERVHESLNKALTPAQGQVLIDTLCTAQGIADLSAQIAEINEVAAGFIEDFDFFPVNILPGAAQVIRFLGALSSFIGGITDIIDRVAEFLPEFGDVSVSIEDNSLTVGESTKVEATVDIVSVTKLCGQAAGASIEGLLESIQNALTLRLARAIPGVGRAFSSRNFSRDNAGLLVGLVFDAIASISGTIVDALGLQEQLESLAERICGLLQDPQLLLSSDTLSASCASLTDDTYVCTEPCVGAVTVNAEEDFCGEAKQGSSGLTCEAAPPPPPMDGGMPEPMMDGGGGVVTDAGSGTVDSGGTTTCNCSTPGVTLTPVSGCDSFQDANQCSGWQSVIIDSEGGSFTPEEEAEAASREFSSGSEVTGFGCTIRITC